MILWNVLQCFLYNVYLELKLFQNFFQDGHHLSNITDSAQFDTNDEAKTRLEQDETVAM